MTLSLSSSPPKFGLAGVVALALVPYAYVKFVRGGGEQAVVV